MTRAPRKRNRGWRDDPFAFLETAGHFTWLWLGGGLLAVMWLGNFVPSGWKIIDFSHPWWLLAWPPAITWVVWWARKSDVSLGPGRRRVALGLRLVVCTLIVLALAGGQWRRPVEGMNVFFLLDRSDSIPAEQQEAARQLVTRLVGPKPLTDQAGVIVFGAEASIDRLPNVALDLPKIEAVINPQRSDLAAAIQLGTAAFPETGQKRLVLLSDGNENIGDAINAVRAGRSQGVTVDVIPLGVARANDVSVQRLQLPSQLKQGQAFEAKIFVQADTARPATVRLYRNEQFLGEQPVELTAGKNLFAFSQTLTTPGFYHYEARVEVPGDPLPQNNRAFAFATVRGEPRLLVISNDPELDGPLVAALQSAQLEIRVTGPEQFPDSLAALQSYDTIFLSNVGAGDLGRARLRLLESAVRDFGVGLVGVGGDEAFTAGGYRGTPLEDALPVSMELDSKKVLPNGALALVIDRSGSMQGEKMEMAKAAAIGALAALGDQDYVAVIAFDSTFHEIAPLQRASHRRAIMRDVAGIDAQGGTVMHPPMARAYEMLKGAKASLKHCVVLTDGQSQPGDFEGLVRAMVADRITLSTVGVGSDIDEALLQSLAALGGGRFYPVQFAGELPQVFIKETAIILKSAIHEEPFQPQLKAVTELVRGIGGAELPSLQGYVVTTPKPRAETPLWTDKGDPLLAHWQYGLGRVVAFTSDARSKWAKHWLGWAKYRQFWSQAAQWSLRRLANADFTAEVTLDQGEGLLAVEAVDAHGDYRNFLELQATVVSPAGRRETVTLQQTGPGHYEARFPTREVGAYLLHLMDMENGQVRGAQVVGASVNYSPEFNASGPNWALLRRIAESSGGRVLDPALAKDNPFLHNRRKTYQPRELWETLLKLAIVLFVGDVGVRRVQWGREEWQRGARVLRRWVFFWKSTPRPVETQESLATLLARRDQVRTAQTFADLERRSELFQPAQPPSPEAVVATVHAPQSTSPPPAESSADTSAAPPASTASRLLAAKRRAHQKRG